MALETAATIGQLNPSYPSGADRIHQGDDHIRLIKAALKATFPNITGPITKSQDELNVAPFAIPRGIIVAWFGAEADIPAGWVVCNGTNGTPDLRDRVVIGAGASFAALLAVGAPTASAVSSSEGAHGHTIAGGSHTHAVNLTPTAVGGSISTTLAGVENEQNNTQVLKSASFTPGAPHTHAATADQATHSHTVSTEGAHQHSVTVSTLQPSTALHMIMKS